MEATAGTCCPELLIGALKTAVHTMGSCGDVDSADCIFWHIVDNENDDDE